MEQLSKIIPIFAMSLRENGDIHRGELLSFDPSENLENSSIRARSGKGCSSYGGMYRLLLSGA